MAHKTVLKALKLERQLTAIEAEAEMKASRRKPRSAAQIAATKKAFPKMMRANRKRLKKARKSRRSSSRIMKMW